jgi:lysozyme
MWAGIEAGDFHTASVEMLDSRWAKQVKSRAVKLSDAMKNGEF